MSTHSSIPAWRIPWAEEPGGLQSTDATEATEHTCEHAHPCIYSFTHPFIPRSHPSRRQPGLSTPSLWIRPFWTLDTNGFCGNHIKGTICGLLRQAPFLPADVVKI